MALEESQSLLLEMIVGRSRAFVQYLRPLLEKHFAISGPEWEPDNLYRRLNNVQRSLIRVDADEVTYPLHILLRYELEFADYFISHLLTRTAQVEADLAAQLFSSSEMRLARALLLLSNYGNDIGLAPIPVRVNHETLAKMIGTTRARVTTFMNKFRKSGFIDYNGKLDVHLSLLNFVLNQQGGLDLTE